MRPLYYIALCTMLLIGCASTISDKITATTEVEYRPAEPVTVSSVDEMTVTLEELGIIDSSPNAAHEPKTLSADGRTGTLSKTVEAVINAGHPASKARVMYSVSADSKAGTMTCSIDNLTIESEKEVIKEITTHEVVKESFWSKLNRPINFIIMLVVLLVILAIVFRKKL